MDLSEIQNTILDRRTKGIPGSSEPFPLKELKNKKWNILKEDMPMPLMVLKQKNYLHNLKTFSNYLEKHNLDIAPHGKTTMAPQIFSEQIKHGAWGITAGAINQIQVMFDFGIKKVLLANQLLGKSHLKKEDFLKLVNIIGEDSSKNFTFAGISSYEGIAAVAMKGSDAVHDFCSKIEDIINDIPSNYYSHLNELLITAGGSTHFDIVGERFSKIKLSVPIKVLLRSGCYITHDHGPYLDALETAKSDSNRQWDQSLQPALEIWSYVQSIPENNLAFLTMGKRDAPYDSGLPKPIKRFRPGEGFLDIGEAEIFSTNDQHAFVKLADNHQWQVGDMICSGISHPCTAFDKWKFIPVVDDDYNVLDGILTYF